MAPTLVKSLSRLSASSLIDLCLQWLDMRDHCTPYLQSNRSLNESEEEDYLFPPAQSVDELRKIYKDLRASNADKSHIIDRIIDGDWRRGLSLQQLAMVDFALLGQSDTALRWSALKLTPLQIDESLPKGIEERATKRRKVNASASSSLSPPTLPSMQPSTFVAALKSHISPLVKAHYHLHRLPAPYNLSIVRIYISSRCAFAPTAANVPRSARHATDASRVVYIALPESCRYVYISLTNSAAPRSAACTASKDKPKKSGAPPHAPMDLASMKRCILESIPKAFSRPHERWALEATKLTAKSLHAICALRGSGRPGTAGGAYSPFSTDTHGALGPAAPVSAEVDVHLPLHLHASLDRFHVRINDVVRPPDQTRASAEAAPIGLSFAGADIFLGLKQLASLADGRRYIDLDKLPSWMTGEMGVSVMTVQ
ncbi:hypothetical protein DV737_g4926, partial [Chaetothyriales sp. CBS 132003]